MPLGDEFNYVTSGNGTGVAKGNQFRDNYAQFQQAYPNQVSEENPKLNTESLHDALTLTPGLVVAQFANTVASSVGLVEDTFLQENLKKYLPNAYNYYIQNKGAIELTGDAVGAIIPGTLAVKALQTTTRAGKLLSTVPYFRHLAINEQRIARIQRALEIEREQAALNGIAGHQIVPNLLTHKLARQRLTAGITKGVKETAAAELGILATMNSSEVLFPDEWSWYDHLPYIATGGILGVGIEAIAARKAIADAARRSAFAAHAALNPNLLPLDELISRPGNRDVAVTLNMADIRQLDEMIAESEAQIKNPTLYNQAEQTKRVREAEIFGEQTGERHRKGLIDNLAAEVVTDGKNTVSARTDLNPAERENFRVALQKDPYALLGVKAINPYVGTKQAKDEFLKTRQSYVDGLRMRADKNVKRANSGKVSKKDKKRLLDEADEFRAKAAAWSKEEMQPFVLRNGELMPLENDVLQFTDLADAHTAFRQFDDGGQKGLKIEKFKDPVANRNISFGVDYGFNFMGKESLENITSFSPFQRSAVFATYDRLMQTFKRSPGSLKDNPILLTKKENWVRLDAIDEALSRGVIHESDIRFAEGQSVQSIRHEVLNQKYKEFLRLHEQNGKVQVGGRSLSVRQKSEAEIRYMLNLPAAQMGNISPLEELFHAFRAQGTSDLTQYGYQEIVDQVLKLRSMPNGLEFMPLQMQELAQNGFAGLLRGNSFAPRRVGETGPYVKPLTVWRANLSPNGFTRQALELDLAARRTEVMTRLTTAQLDPSTGVMVPPEKSLVASLANEIRRTDAYETSLRVDMINEGSARSQGVIAQSRFSTRDDPVFNALHDVNTLADRRFQQFISDLYEETGSHGRKHVEVFNSLRAKANEGDLFELGMYMNARAEGWVLKPGLRNETVQGQARYSFVLDEQSAHNQRRFKQLFGMQLEDGTLMPVVRNDDKYEPLRITELAKQGAESFAQIGARLLPEQNRLLSAMGLSPIRFKEWWVPPRTFANKEVAYVITTDDHGTVKRMITANTEKELQAKIDSEEIQDFMREQGGRIVRQSEMELFHKARDRAFYDLLDAGDPLVKRDKGSRGSSVDPTVQSGRERLDDAVRSINGQVQNIGRDTLGLMYESQIAYAARANLVHPQAGNKTSIWKRYEDVILGNRALRRDSTVGKYYTQIESHFDQILHALWDATRGKGITGIVGEKATVALHGAGLDINAKRFAKLKEQLGDYLPYENTMEFVQSQFNVKPPKTAKELAAQLAYITSTITLRLFEVAHPLLNMAGVVATMPAVMQALARKVGETEMEHAARIGTFGRVLPGKDRITILDTVRLFGQSMSFAFTKEGQMHLQIAAKRGDLEQYVSEIHETMTKPQKGEGWFRDFVDVGVEYASKLSDKSETAARAWAHLGGILLAKHIGYNDVENMHIFARRFADQVIGDYRSSNRPVVFQGAVGMPLGLFQTYMWNYYQRLFGYIERKDYKALAVQFGMQAAVFGGTTIPGYSLFNEMWNNAQDGKSTPIDAIQQRYGTATADLLLYGTLSNIPKIFSDDGIALYTRGDTSPRVPAFIDPRNAPIVNLAESVYNIVGATIDQFKPGGQGFNPQQMAETVGTYFVNRPIKGLFELAAGYSVDRRGNVVSNEIRNGLSIFARSIGLRPLSETKQIEVLQRQRVTELSQQAIRTRLSSSLKSAFRGESFDGDMIVTALQDYVRSGGQPEYFPRFLKTTILNALTPKAQKQLIDHLKGSPKLQEAMRLLNAGVPLEAQ